MPSPSHCLRAVLGLALENKMPMTGTKANKNGTPVPLKFFHAAELDGMVTVRVNGTGKGPGVIVAGEKLQLALAGNELVKQESVIAYLGSPVLAFS